MNLFDNTMNLFDNTVFCISNYLDALSPSFICGIVGVATISAVSTIHQLFMRCLKLTREKKRKISIMKGVVIRSYNGVSSVELCTNLPVPKILNEDEVLIRVIAAGIDTMDLMVTRGYGRSIRSYLRRNNEHVEDDSAILLGRECSGVVIATGRDVETVTKGDKVWAVSAYCLEGLMAEYVVVKEKQVSMKPQNITFEEAASLPYAAIQVGNVIVNQACLNTKSTKNKRILLITGNSSVGLFAIQLLKAWGGDVTAAVPTVGLPMCHVLGVDDIIVYSVTDFETELRKRKRFDVVINATGTIIHQLCLDVTSPGGKVITFTKTPILTDRFEIVLGSVLSFALQTVAWIKKVKQGMFSSFWWDNFSYDKKYLQEAKKFVEEGKIRPIIEKVYDMEEAILAFSQLARHDNVGKSVLRISSNQEFD